MKTDTLHVLLGRYGDCIIALPSLKRWADLHGRPAAVFTSKEFLPLFDGVSYVKAAAAPCTFHDLQSALDFLKTDLPGVPVKCLQFYQSGEDPVLPSFWHEQMYLAGLLDGSDEPLVFDLRDERREAALRLKYLWPLEQSHDKEVILFAGEGKSSPFKDSGLLAALIHQSFPECNFIDLSEIKAERIYDLLGLYDHAAALISIDTVHLHLSKASKVPVFALARDYPSRWHGTPHQSRFHYYCRYGQVMERADELINAIRSVLEFKTSIKPKFLPLPKGSYNPSIIVHEGRELISYRHHPDPRNWRTQIMLDGLPVKFPYPVSMCAHEDMRLFHFQGKLWASYVCARGSKTDPRCVQGYGELVKAKGFWAIREHFQPKMPGNDWSGMQKNMVCFEWNEEIMAIWANGHVIEPKRSAYILWEAKTEPATWPYGEIRGGTSPLPFRGKWLRFFHSRVWPDGRPWRYHIGALLMEPQPPFNVIKVSSRPILSGDESGDPMIPHYKHSCCLPYGVVEDGDGWKVSLGINDAHSAVLHVRPEDLNL